MAKAGVASRATRTAPARSVTRQALIDAAIETLRSEGYTGASARSIARRAGCNQALVFYHFGSVVELLLAALDEVSARRMDRYSAAIAEVETPADLVRVAAEIFAEDLNNGYVAVLVQMIAGASTTPGLDAEVAARIAPWRQFSAEAIGAGLSGSPLGSILPLDQVAHAVVAVYLGLEMLSHIDGDRATATELFARVSDLVGLFGTTKRPSGRKT